MTMEVNQYSVVKLKKINYDGVTIKINNIVVKNL